MKKLLIAIAVLIICGVSAKLAYNNLWFRFLAKSVYHGHPEYVFNLPLHIFKSSENRLPILNLKIAKADLKKINNNVAKANNLGYLSANLKDKFKVTINDSLKGKARLKGDYNDHRQNNSYSYKIDLKKGDYFLGLNKFSIQKPETRGGLSEWFMHQYFKNAGFTTITYDFINLSLNKKQSELYAIEESISNSFLKRYGIKESFILSFDESDLIEKKYKHENFTNDDYFKIAKIKVCSKKQVAIQVMQNLDAFRKTGENFNTLFDVEKTAQFFAINDLLGNSHSILWENIHFYLNNNNLLEPIAYDGNEHDNIKSILYEKWQQKKYPHACHSWIDLFFSQPEFKSAYFKALAEITEPNKLEHFYKSIENQIEPRLHALQADNAFYIFYDYKYFKNRNYIQNYIKQHRKLPK